MAEESKVPGPDAVIDDELFDPAVKWFAGRLAMTRKQVDQMTLDARRKVFFVTGLSDMEAIKGVQDSLARALEKGDTFEEWKAQVKEKNLFRGPEFTGHRLETIFRTNMQNAFQTGRYMEMTTPAVMKRRPYWRFSAVRDGRTTPVCASAHGTVLKADHPWWKTHIPPLHFNCRSTIVPMTEAAAHEAGITEHPTELNAALGFGNSPFGVPAAAKDLPTAKEQAEIRKASEAVQTAVEERNAASDSLQKARHEETKARNALKKAKKAMVRATDEELPERRKAVQQAEEASSRAEEKTKAAEQALQKSQAEAEKLAHQGKESRWTLVKARIERLKKGVASGAAEILGRMQDLVDELTEVVVDGVPELALALPSRSMAYISRGDKVRGGIVRHSGTTGRSSKAKPEEPIDLDTIDVSKAAKLFFGGNMVVAKWWKAIRPNATRATKDAVEFYKGSQFRKLNENLRSNVGLTGIQLSNKNRLVELLSSQKAPEDLVLHRGAGGLSVLKSMFPDIVPEKDTIAGWKESLEKRIASRKSITTTDLAFMSTSLSEKHALKSDVYLTINVRNGQKGVAPIVGKNKRFQNQQEILIEPGRTLSCTSVGFDRRGGIRITCELLLREDER